MFSLVVKYDMLTSLLYLLFTVIGMDKTKIPCQGTPRYEREKEELHDEVQQHLEIAT